MMIDTSMLPFGKKKRIRDSDYRKSFNGQRCIVCGKTETTIGAHVRHGLTGGTGLKPSDTLIMPLCAYHHSEESKDQVKFWMKHRGWSIDQVKEIARERYHVWKND